jgi:hypothetical protein
MTDKEIAVKFSNLASEIATLDRHEKIFQKRLDDINIGMVDVNTTLKIILAKVDNLPERVRAIELEKAENRYVNSVVKPVFIFLIGMFSSYLFNNVVVANRDEKTLYKKERNK